MGLNVVIACHRHRCKSYMMRGEESHDLQHWMRSHGPCFEARSVDIYRDSDDYPEEYEDEWEHESRPVLVIRSRAAVRVPRNSWFGGET